ncbi:MAG: GNAT family N-acetyltransferase [Saprospiraceae bacterium]
MQIQLFTQHTQLQNNALLPALESFVLQHPNGNFFQSPTFFEFIQGVKGYRPFQLLALNEDGEIRGALLGVFQSNGGNLKSWLSRRLIVWGGPLVTADTQKERNGLVSELLKALKKQASGSAIFAEFRNFFDTTDFQSTFENLGFAYHRHLNYLVKTDEEAATRSRVSKSRMRQIKSSLKLGATIEEAANEAEVVDFYNILTVLYKEKVKKPLPGLELFLQFYKNPSFCKFFVIKYEEQVVGGIVCPIFNNKVIYEWYVCGNDGVVQGLHPSVLATWAPIEYGYRHGYDHFDFMGAGKPEEDYGVREFKARFGGEEVCFGRYNMILNQPLYKVGQLGLKVYQKIK